MEYLILYGVHMESYAIVRGENVKIAYIVLCHKNVKQINSLIHSLSNETSDFYLHIDLKSKIDREAIVKEHTYILPKEYCVDIRWGEDSMVIATLKMIKAIIETGIKYDYIWLISGQDFPIKPLDEIHSFLERNNGYNFIEVFDKESTMHKRYDKRNAIWYPRWMAQNHVFIKILRRLYIGVTGGYNHTFWLKRKNNIGIEFRYGSQWWTLTYDCACYIFRYIDEHPRFLEHFKYTLIPDECVFQTVFMVSPYANKRRNNLTYIDWSENKRSPKTFTIKDYNLLMNQDSYLIARKFDYDIDSNIIKSIFSNNEVSESRL